MLTPIRRLIAAALPAIALLSAGPMAAQEIPPPTDFYDAAILAETEARSADAIRQVLRADIIGNLPAAQAATAAGVRLVFPVVDRGPLSFWAYPQLGVIAVPLPSLRLFGDLSLVYAWFDHRQCDLEPVQAYMLRVMAREEMPPPLEAFGLDRATVIAATRIDPVSGNVLSADDLSQKLFSSALYFILAHELGHIVLAHEGGAAGALSQAQERAADRFALGHFARVGAPPTGILYFYLSVWWTDPVAASRAGQTHPLSADRMARVAEALAADPAAYSWREPVPAIGAAQVADIARMMGVIAGIAADDDLRRFAIQYLATTYPPERLPGICP